MRCTLIALAATLALAGCGNEPGSTDQSVPPATVTVTQRQPQPARQDSGTVRPPNHEFAIGDKIPTEPWSVTITGVSYPETVTEQYMGKHKPKAGKFIVVDVDYTNVSKKPDSYYGSVTLVDAQDRQYSASDVGMIYGIKGSVVNETIQPMQTEHAKLVFDVPTAANPTQAWAYSQDQYGSDKGEPWVVALK